MLTKTFFAVGALLTQLVHGALQPPVDGYSVVDVQWSLPVDPSNPNGARESVTGTIEEAIAQMEAAHPGWNQTFTSNIKFADTHTLLTRDDNPVRDSWECNYKVNVGPANSVNIRDGARYLSAIDSPPPKNAPLGCGRVSCAYNSAIWWCNDNSFEYEITWKNIASSAWTLQDECSFWDGNTEKVCAWEKMQKKWKVYVLGASC
ncbi:hypothetical protein QBC41DRAFT_338878 [Cercophora samala]|uniref:Uncharacterized protein n=1 Tax=Cercophora samala TaxID=330535 RepID=A0AA39Z9F4_9PEZI|nr:hypothetical protein QBC41DRAFT_338878 [Cercophora samala]